MEYCVIFRIDKNHTINHTINYIRHKADKGIFFKYFNILVDKNIDFVLTHYQENYELTIVNLDDTPYTLELIRRLSKERDNE